MQNEPQILTQYALYEEELLDNAQIGLTLTEAFHALLSRLDCEPVWDTEGDNLRLRFRYLSGPHAGRFYGEDSHPGPFVETFTAPAFGGNKSRDNIMRQVISAGWRGWRIETLAVFYRDRAMIEGKERQRAGRFY